MKDLRLLACLTSHPNKLFLVSAFTGTEIHMQAKVITILFTRDIALGEDRYD